MVFLENGAMLHRFKDFLHIWLHVIHNQEDPGRGLALGGVGLVLDQNDIMEVCGENVWATSRQLPQNVYFSDKLLQRMEAVKNVGHELDGEHFSIGLPDALDHFAEGPLAEHLDQLVVLLDGLPEVGVIILALTLIL